ncbi:splicing regulatory glutamine/lysine-rich protein 1-like [Impatiens glandulifera]|uniref:splicing regulatory glutamine/lysine-rich protein 1-like n=1 Tax=Impatiens glandulifera TaxID=253017 RepID=UPI001FB19CA8|nr:splicing regulatory glutamine/lysine-rich protein 1-like [Impatiens glandulifera]
MANTLQTSIRSMIDEAVQTSVKSLIAESVQTATAPLVDMLQAMAIQIRELSKLQVSKTQEQINSDAETAKKLKDEEREKERSRKEFKDKDHELAQKCNEEEQAAIHEPISAQPSQAMKTRNKNKRKAVAEVMKRAEQNSQRVIETVGMNVQPLDEEEEEDIDELNRRKKRANESSTATPSSRPTVAQPSRPPQPVCHYRSECRRPRRDDRRPNDRRPDDNNQRGEYQQSGEGKEILKALLADDSGSYWAYSDIETNDDEFPCLMAKEE